MKKVQLSSSKQLGFNLLEVLVALALFSIVALGSSKVLAYMMKSQADMHRQSIVLDTLQLRLQNISDEVDKEICESIDLQSFAIAETNYYVGCFEVEIKKDSTVLAKRPVLAATDISAEKATECFQNNQPSDSCFVLGI